LISFSILESPLYKRFVIPGLAIGLALYAIMLNMMNTIPKEEAGSHVTSKTYGTATDFGIKTTTGEVRLKEHKGKVVLLDFWATWCGPCRQSIPGIQRLYSKYKDQGFIVMGPAMENDSGAKVAPFAKDMGITYPVGLPTKVEEIAPYRSESIPATVLIDRKGEIRWASIGYSEGTERLMGENIEILLKEAP